MSFGQLPIFVHLEVTLTLSWSGETNSTLTPRILISSWLRQWVNYIPRSELRHQTKAMKQQGKVNPGTYAIKSHKEKTLFVHWSPCQYKPRIFHDYLVNLQWTLPEDKSNTEESNAVRWRETRFWWYCLDTSANSAQNSGYLWDSSVSYTSE